MQQGTKYSGGFQTADSKVISNTHVALCKPLTRWSATEDKGVNVGYTEMLLNTHSTNKIIRL